MSGRQQAQFTRYWEQLDVLRKALVLSDEHYGSAAIGVETGRESDGAPAYLFQTGVLLVREDALPLVRTQIPGADPVEAIDGMTLVSIGDRPVPETLDRLDTVLGAGLATPNHIASVTNVNLCPADEPVPVGPGAVPIPPVSPGDAGTGVRVHVIDTGLVDDHGQSWLAGVEGEPNRTSEQDELLPFYLGHGTFVAGVLRCIAPGTTVTVSNELRRAGAITEFDLNRALLKALSMRPRPDIISLSAGGRSRGDLPYLGLEPVMRRLREPGAPLLVAAAGNDAVSLPFWPAAFPETLSVGALREDGGGRACFSDFGDWVDVFAPGERLVNAFTHGSYGYLHAPSETCRNTDPALYEGCTCVTSPLRTELRTFAGMAEWSGTSFATPWVVGLIAARMSRTGETPHEAAAALRAQAQAAPGRALR